MTIFISSQGIFLFWGAVKGVRSTFLFQLEMKRKANIKNNYWDFPQFPLYLHKKWFYLATEIFPFDS